MMTNHRFPHAAAFLLCVAAASGRGGEYPARDGWTSLFDGTTLDGWKAAENPASFAVKDGAIVAAGPRAHLFYAGALEAHDFTNFELAAEIMTSPNSNSGIYFHTAYQEKGWPSRGIEVQVNNSFPDPIKTGSLYGLTAPAAPPAKDGAWFTLRITVVGKRVVTSVDGAPVAAYTEPAPAPAPAGGFDRRLSHGTFALQAHDPGSTVRVRRIAVRPLAALDFPVTDFHVHLKGGLTLAEALANAEARGLKFGIAENCGVGFPVASDAGLAAYLARLGDAPAWKGLQAEGREWVGLVSAEMVARFDYVITDSMTFADDEGRRMRLWIDGEVRIGDPEKFMDLLVARTVGILEKEPIDIYANATFLPRALADRYDALWTEARMDRVIAAAVANGVAIEINSRFRVPSAAFVARARKAGARFSFGTNNGDKDLGNLEYSLYVAKAAGLTKDDMFAPAADGHKPVQRKGLPAAR
ncbi:MAG TPA: hypothetical protein DCM87_19585 [Planctomycetes bacterium]|nr:hypothetical protein [Planctomycetota bacterium]